MDLEFTGLGIRPAFEPISFKSVDGRLVMSRREVEHAFKLVMASLRARL